MEIKAKLLEMLEQAHNEENVFVTGLSDAERSAAGAPNHWAAKDVVAHVAFWKQRMAQRLSAAARDEAPPTSSDYNQVNADVFEQYREASWAEILELSSLAQAKLIEQLQLFAEDDLIDTERFPWQEGRPLWRNLVGNSYVHPLTHFAQSYLERGDTDRATEIQESAAELATKLDDSPSWRGVTIYNLACHYALCGHTNRAISLLGEALQLSPDLTEWSKEDPDFASIREDPDYQSLYAS